MFKLGVINKIIISSSALEGVAKIKFEDRIGLIFCYILLIKYYEPGERPQMVEVKDVKRWIVFSKSNKNYYILHGTNQKFSESNKCSTN
ncbi:hypothetical protein [Clostridium folliculivorans]|uniref:Uncharacterized protein n=1 Tax=Clostridium folliculivorans TaxID=2886038 RepID=A0A9W5Y4N7_9CLOT|nr:hypothetical protein [Clostridium folliculivorans]GKU26593.1 hypothetical protein CFOLD11_34200 [Clostridium folliculivorans]GKU28975.1 hypothetical protein CFB3_10810 [Clostridium folliculivorans]